MQLDEAAEAIEKDQIQCMGIGRQLLTDEQYITKIREGRLEDIRPCISCHLGCLGYGLWKDSGAVFSSTSGCALNPYCLHEEEYKIEETSNPKRFAVVGGGLTQSRKLIDCHKSSE